MSLAFLIPAYNSEGTIEEALNSINPSCYPGSDVPVMVYVSDNASSDSTYEAAIAFGHNQAPRGMLLRAARQEVNLGAYGNLRYLQEECNAEWGYILCADDTLVGGAVELVENQLHSVVDANISMIAFEDESIVATRRIVRKVNGSSLIKGARGLALVLLYGCFFGGLSNACIRTKGSIPASRAPRFDSSFKYFGDINYYVDLLRAGSLIMLSPVITNVRRKHANQLSNTGGIDNSHFSEARAVVLKCLHAQPVGIAGKLFLGMYVHSVLYSQFYRLAVKKLFASSPMAFRALVPYHSGGIYAVSFWCFVSVFMPSPVRSIIRYCCRSYLLACVKS